MTSRFRFITVSVNHSFNCFGEPPQTDLFAGQNNIIYVCGSKTVTLLVHFRAILHQTLTWSTQRSLACVCDLFSMCTGLPRHHRTTDNNKNARIHASCAHQRPERSDDTY